VVWVLLREVLEPEVVGTSLEDVCVLLEVVPVVVETVELVVASIGAKSARRCGRGAISKAPD